MKIPKLNITHKMEWYAAIQAAEDYCKMMNSHSQYKDATGNLRSSYGYTIKGDILIVYCGMNLVYKVNLPPVEHGNENK